MYTCSTCKEQFDGEAALKNACGEFCAECKAAMMAKSAAAAKQRSQAWNGNCIWCGEKITPDRMQSGKDNESVCRPCTKHRDWLLRAIRLSDRPARYVARIEERESPMREERLFRTQQAAKQEPTEKAAAPTEQGEQLRRLELVLNKLTQALGL